jgi:hypothetical protein
MVVFGFEKISLFSTLFSSRLGMTRVARSAKVKRNMVS